MDAFQVGNAVDKAKGYRFPGTVVSVFKNTRGDTRYVVELDELGLLHIFNEEQLVPRVRVHQSGYFETHIGPKVSWEPEEKAP